MGLERYTGNWYYERDTVECSDFERAGKCW